MPRTKKKHGGKRSGAGRPAQDVTASERVEVRLTPAQREQWETAAAKEGTSIKAWLVAAAELAIARGSTR